MYDEKNFKELSLKKRPHRSRPHRITVSFNDEELAALNYKASKTIMSREKFCREILLGSVIVERPPAEYGEILRELRVVGNNVYRLHQKAIQVRFIDEVGFVNLYNMIVSMDEKFTRAFAIKRKRKTAG